MAKILFVEDEEILGNLVKDALEYQPDFEVNWVKDGKEAFAFFQNNQPDICILDVMIPSLDGYALAKQIRKINTDIPIIFLTARSATADVVKGFDVGGNDYLKKPFSIEELVARVRNLLKNTQPTFTGKEEVSATYNFGLFKLIPDTQMLYKPSEKVNLTGRECDILKELVIHKNKVVEKQKLQIQIWGIDTFFNSRTIDVYVAKLRKHLAEDKNISIINVRGYGYKLIEEKN